MAPTYLQVLLRLNSGPLASGLPEGLVWGARECIPLSVYELYPKSVMTSLAAHSGDPHQAYSTRAS